MTESELEITVNEVANVVPLIHVIRAYREAWGIVHIIPNICTAQGSVINSMSRPLNSRVHINHGNSWRGYVWEAAWTFCWSEEYLGPGGCHTTDRPVCSLVTIQNSLWCTLQLSTFNSLLYLPLSFIIADVRLR
jgi:hypothetical protein